MVMVDQTAETLCVTPVVEQPHVAPAMEPSVGAMSGVTMRGGFTDTCDLCYCCCDNVLSCC